MHQIIIVGGGAGGLELATRLGDTLGKKGLAEITLIEKSRTHFWKPHLHELAAGSVDLDIHELDYLAQSFWHNFRYRIGEMTGIDREKQLVHVAPYFDDEGEQVTEERSFYYDTLVMAVGSHTNDFGTHGVSQYAVALESTDEADRFHRRLVNAFLRAHAQSTPLRPEQLQVVIVGAGATGVELAAELHNATRDLVAYNLDRIEPDKHIQIHLVEASTRILPALPVRISDAAQRMLSQLNIQVHTGAAVAQVMENAVCLVNGTVIPGELVVWAAGVKAPHFLTQLGLETNAINQLIVRDTLQTTVDPKIFAIGDCAACAWHGHEGKTIPPRAQAAHQQSNYLIKALPKWMNGEPFTAFRYRDFGSLVSLGDYTTVGHLMGNFAGRSLWVEGLFARYMYISLYKLHEMALHGFWKMALTTLSRFISRRTVPHVKLH
jgi:NADH dehydrogenase